MKNKVFSVLFVLAFAVLAPCAAFADDSTSESTTIATAESAQDVQGITDDVNSGIDKYGGGISDAFSSLKETWSQTVTAPLAGAAAINSFMGSVFESIPVYEVWLLLFFVVLAVVGMVKALIK